MFSRQIKIKTQTKNAMKIFLIGPYCLSIPIFLLCLLPKLVLSWSRKMLNVETRVHEDNKMRTRKCCVLWNCSCHLMKSMRLPLDYETLGQKCQRKGALLRWADYYRFSSLRILGNFGLMTMRLTKRGFLLWKRNQQYFFNEHAEVNVTDGKYSICSVLELWEGWDIRLKIST